MAEQLLLVRTYDFESDQGTVDLLTRTVHGFEPAYQGWTPNVVPSRRSELVEEAITLRVNGTATDAIATSLQRLAEMAKFTDDFYSDGVENYAVWLRVQQYGETKGRQSLVRELRHEPASSVFDVSLRSSYHWNKYTLGISREPWWEGTAAGSVTASSVSMYGGTFAYGTIQGDMNARLAKITVDNGNGTIWPWGQFWLGFRSTRYSGTPSAWVSKHLPTYKVSTPGTLVADAYAVAVAGSAIQAPYYTGSTVFPDGSTIAQTTMGSVTGGTPEHMFGSFLVLARAKVKYGSTADWSAGTSTLDYRVRMVTYYGGDDDDNYSAKVYPRVIIGKDTNGNAGTADTIDSYQFYELGEVHFPPPGRKMDTNWSSFKIEIQADPPSMTGLAGTAYLNLDGMYFIPTEGLYSGGRGRMEVMPAVPSKLGGSAAYVGYNGPDGYNTGYIGSTATTNRTLYGVQEPYYRAGIPAGTGIAVYVASPTAIGALPGTAWKSNIVLYTFDRWQTLRGNE